MANQEQLAILKQGVEVWNKWRKENPSIKINLIDAKLAGSDLSKADLNGADFLDADLSETNLTKADLSKADLREANLSEANFSNVNLWMADLSFANLSGIDLRRAGLDGATLNFTEANLNQAHLREANLSGAELSESILTRVDLWGANLIGSNFFKVKVAETIFGNIDLSQVKSLEEIAHFAPSSVSTDTFDRSNGKIPEIFLRGCGLSDWEIVSVELYNPDLSNNEFIDIQNRIFDLRNRQALQISPLFISYSHGDDAFVDGLEGHLSRKGIRFWRDVHDMKSGRIETQVNRAIRQNPTVLLILSEHSLNSDWVEYEVRTARELEKEIGRDVLCPVALDDSWKTSPWPKRFMEQVMEYNILDFSSWHNNSKFENTFNKLIDGLGLFYKG